MSTDKADKKKRRERKEGNKVGGAVVLEINAARAKRTLTTPDGLSFCPLERKNQYTELTPEEGQELFKQLTGRGEEEDEG